MKFEIEIKQEAREDIADIFLWYEKHQAHLGYLFLDKFEERISFIQKDPQVYSKKYKEFRQALISKFPYLIIFEILENKVIVYAVIHGKRKPSLRFKRK
jgi:plasmid stabilization system protein ParE